MARPRKDGLDYFPHDTKASEDDKLDAFRCFYGNDGYAFYFILREHIHRTDEAELDISDSATVATLASAVMVPIERFHEMLNCSLKLGLFCAELFEVSGVLTTRDCKKLSGDKAAQRCKWRRCKSSIVTDSSEFSTEKTPVFHGENEFSTVITPVFHGDNPKKAPEFSTEKTPPDAVSSNYVLKDLSSLKDLKDLSSRSLPPSTNTQAREAPPPFEYEGKLDVLKAMNHYHVQIHGFLHFETIRSYQDMLDDELILAAIKESGGRSDSYCVRVVASWHGRGWRKITDHPNYRPLPEGGEVVEIARGRVERQRSAARTSTQIAFEEAGRRSRPGRQVHAPRE